MYVRRLVWYSHLSAS